MKLLKLTFILLAYFQCTLSAQSFVHPGLLHSKEDLERMK